MRPAKVTTFFYVDPETKEITRKDVGTPAYTVRRQRIQAQKTQTTQVGPFSTTAPIQPKHQPVITTQLPWQNNQEDVEDIFDTFFDVEEPYTWDTHTVSVNG